jgi:hypothetical protein
MPRCVLRLLGSFIESLKRKGEDMKTSIVRGVLLFAAGVVCASVIANVNPKVKEEPMTVKLFEQRAQRLLVELADLGRYAGPIKDGRWGIYQLPVDACVTPPRPTVTPPGVNPVALQAMLDGLGPYDAGLIAGSGDLVYLLDGKCHPVKPQ